jgi:hypothetical protein
MAVNRSSEKTVGAGAGEHWLDEALESFATIGRVPPIGWSE